MKQLQRMAKPFFLSVIIASFFASCSPLIAVYDANAYAQAISIKVDLQNLADESATTNYTNAKADVDKVTSNIQKALEYDRGREKDSLSTKQYEILLADGHSYKTFLQLWQSQGKISATAAAEFKSSIGQIMDRIIRLENGKNRSNN